MLQGTLNEFSLADVFSLLALTKKSGALRVTSDASDGRVFFREGGICLALSDANRVPLVARLVSAGLIGEEELRGVVADHGGSSVAVTDALLRSGQVEDRILSVFLREQIVDAVFELMRLDEGCFSFDATEPGLSRGVTLGVVEVVGEANRRLDEWQAINVRIASPDAVLAMIPAATEGREGFTLDTEQWDLLALIDGRRTVAEVVELTGKGEFATCRVLGDLVEAGLVEAQDPTTGEQTRLDKLIAAREALRSLERIEQPGINPRLSAAAPLGPKGSAVRWIAPAPEADTAPPATPARPGVMTSRSRTAEATLDVTEAPKTALSPEPAEAEAGKAAQAAEAAVPAESAPSVLDLDAVADPEDTAADTVGDVPVTAAAEAKPVASSRNSIDRAHMARELASLGLDDDGPALPVDPSHAARLTRDEEVNKGLLLRLIDGVKGA